MSEAAKNKHRILHLLEGNGIDIGCGDDKIIPHAIGVDMVRRREDVNWVLDVRQGLPFKDETLDWVHSSHTLEDIENTAAALREWWRVLKVGGVLILYLPHRHYYPNIGQPHANAGHKHDFVPLDVLTAAKGAGLQFNLEVEEVFAPPGGRYDYENRGEIEYSFLLVMRKHP